MLKTLTSRPAWRQLVTASIALPVLVGLAVFVFAWPAAHVGPRELPIGIIGAGASTEHAVKVIEANEPDAFDLKIFGDAGSARQAIEDRDIYGAIDVSGPQVTVYTASAASTSVSTLLTGLGGKLQAQLRPSAPGTTTPTTASGARTVDVVPADHEDPHGAVLTAALLPLTICSIIIAAALALALEFGPASRMIFAVTTVAAASGLAVCLVTRAWLGIFPSDGVGTWASLSLLILAMSATTAGLITLVGAPGLGLGAAMMVFVGNPFSGVSAAPELLPAFAERVGQWLPPGAGANLIRSVTYFDGNGVRAYLAILIAWTLFGYLAIVSGHHSFTGFAARRRAAKRTAQADKDHEQPRQPERLPAEI